MDQYVVKRAGRDKYIDMPLYDFSELPQNSYCPLMVVPCRHDREAKYRAKKAVASVVSRDVDIIIM